MLASVDQEKPHLNGEAADIKGSDSPSPKKRKKELLGALGYNGNMANRKQDGSNGVGTSSNSNPADIDESLYSRQLYVLGRDAMTKITQADVLISGMKGLGVEIAKNIILGGCKSVTLHDTENTEMANLSSQFYLSEADIGKNRATASCEKLAELNRYVATTSATCELFEDFIKKFSVVVLTNSSLDEQLRIAEVTRSNGIALIIAETRGLFAQVFNDFGQDFNVLDPNGEPPVSGIILNVTNEEEGIVTCQDETRHGLETGDYVIFTEVMGMTQLNKSEPMKVKELGPFTFSIGDTTNFDRYEGGGIFTQVKMPTKVTFKPLKKALYDQELLMITDFGKLDRPAQIHLAFLTLHEFKKRNNRIPEPWNSADADTFVSLARELNEQFMRIDLNEELLQKFSNICAGDLNPIAAAIGGVVAQEVMKATSGTFTPIRQWLYFDALEALPEDTSSLTVEECSPRGSRYDGQIAVFGSKFQAKMLQQKYFVVGAGAIGCELLKNFAMVGLGASLNGKMTVTDMDVIEKSNLNRQFLFRPWDVSKAKSTTAATAIRRMNPLVNIESHENMVGSTTEHVYDDDFFEGLDGIANALDNVEARLYMDSRCVYYQLPLLESGTLGTKGNTQVVVPHLTECYSSSQDPPEKSFPICTLKNFPNKIEHTLQWARELFEGTFTQAPKIAKQYLENEDFLKNTLKLQYAEVTETLQAVCRMLGAERPNEFNDCIIQARHLFQEQFHNNILQLLHNFPRDATTSTGGRFWSGPKRCPTPAVFDVSDELHMDFIVSAANLIAKVYGFQGSRDRSKFLPILMHVEIPLFTPNEKVKIATTEAEALEDSHDFAPDQLDNVKASLPKKEKCQGLKILEIEFEKDDDTNHHMDFIVAASNLRAYNYFIDCADRHKSKLIAGKIIPAIATTTSLVAGLVGLEQYKLVQGHKKIGLYKNGFVNLALPLITFSEPKEPVRSTYYDTKWSLWDCFDVQALKEDGKEMTLREFMNYFKEKERLAITMISEGVATLSSAFTTEENRKKRLDMPISQIWKDVCKRDIPPQVTCLVLVIACDNEAGKDVEVPFVKYRFRKK